MKSTLPVQKASASTGKDLGEKQQVKKTTKKNPVHRNPAACSLKQRLLCRTLELKKALTESGAISPNP